MLRVLRLSTAITLLLAGCGHQDPVSVQLEVDPAIEAEAQAHAEATTTRIEKENDEAMYEMVAVDLLSGTPRSETMQELDLDEAAMRRFEQRFASEQQ